MCLFLAGCASLQRHDQQSANAPTVDFELERVAFRIGETTVHAQARQFGKGRLTMVNLHDDGSLSVFAGRHQIHYINVEAGPVHLQYQIQMLETAPQLLAELRK